MIYHEQAAFTLIRSDCVAAMRTMPDNSVDSIVTDPPYGIRFMGKAWDGANIEETHAASLASGGHKGIATEAGRYDRRSQASQASQAFQQFSESWAREALRVLKPGGHLVGFASTRTYHRMTSGIEDAGFEIRDQLAWTFGSGFPKSLDVSKAMDRANGQEPRQIGVVNRTGKESGTYGAYAGPSPVTEPVTDDGRKWDGWGTALKPAWEPIVLARKPLEGTVAQNVAKWGTGALNIDACRIEGKPPSVPQPQFNSPTGKTYGFKTGEGRNGEMSEATGRWPANLCHDGSPEVVERFPADAGGGYPEARTSAKTQSIYNQGWTKECPGGPRDMGTGSAARFFYCAKTSREDRDEGLEAFPENPSVTWDPTSAKGKEHAEKGWSLTRNSHPTVKPTELMRWLARLVTPPGGRVLDPFNGSGSTGKACMLEGFHYTGIDLDEEGTYLPIAKARILYALEHADRWEEIHAAPAPEPDIEGQALLFQ